MPKLHGRRLWLAATAVAVVLAAVVSFYASSSPDGLERVAADEGFLDTARDHDLGDGPLADYGVEGVDDERLSGGLAGVVGVVVTLALGAALFRLLRRPDGDGPAPDAHHDGSDAAEPAIGERRSVASDETVPGEPVPGEPVPGRPTRGPEPAGRRD